KLIPVVPDKNVETVLISEIAISVGERKGHPDGVRIETILNHLVILHRNKFNGRFDGKIRTRDTDYQAGYDRGQDSYTDVFNWFHVGSKISIFYGNCR